MCADMLCMKCGAGSAVDDSVPTPDFRRRARNIGGTRGRSASPSAAASSADGAESRCRWRDRDGARPAVHQRVATREWRAVAPKTGDAGPPTGRRPEPTGRRTKKPAPKDRPDFSHRERETPPPYATAPAKHRDQHEVVTAAAPAPETATAKATASEPARWSPPGRRASGPSRGAASASARWSPPTASGPRCRRSGRRC